MRGRAGRRGGFGGESNESPLRWHLRLGPEVAEAPRDRPIVAIESAVFAHGLSVPTNLETALACEEDVRAAGGVPAIVTIVDGMLRVGCDAALLERLTTETAVRKASVRDIAPVLSRLELAATTVAATVEIAALAGIDVVATGGIGGVHRNAGRTGDVSADLLAIAAHPVVVVCAGAKNVLDIPLTLEHLETLGIPVVTYGADDFPAFTIRSSGIRSPYRADSLPDVASIARMRLEQGGGIVVALPIAVEAALDAVTAEAAIAEALAEAERAGVRGSATTPFVLRVIAEREERAVSANIALLRANVRFATALAGALLER